LRMLFVRLVLCFFVVNVVNGKSWLVAIEFEHYPADDAKVVGGYCASKRRWPLLASVIHRIGYLTVSGRLFGGGRQSASISRF